VSLASTEGAAGTFYYQFKVHNAGSSACHIGGYFGVSLYNPAGDLITAVDNRQPKTVSGAPVKSLVLLAGGIASFTVSLVDATCRLSSPKIGAWHFIPPNDTTFDQVSTSFGYQYCGRGINVYPNELGPPAT
jgi:hypothetical protein